MGRVHTCDNSQQTPAGNLRGGWMQTNATGIAGTRVSYGGLYVPTVHSHMGRATRYGGHWRPCIARKEQLEWSIGPQRLAVATTAHDGMEWQVRQTGGAKAGAIVCNTQPVATRYVGIRNVK